MEICRICGQPAEFLSLHRTINSAPLEQCTVCGTVQARYSSEPNARELYDELFQGNAYVQHRKILEQLLQGRQPYRPYETWLLRQAEARCRGKRLVEIGGEWERLASLHKGVDGITRILIFRRSLFNSRRHWVCERELFKTEYPTYQRVPSI